MSRQATILTLPPELLFQILSKLPYNDLVRFASTCRETHSFASPRNQLLWQAIFLSKFDDPRDRWATLVKTAREDERQREREERWDWFVELRRRVGALRAVRSGVLGVDNDEEDGEEAESRKEEVIAALLDIIDTAKACPTESDLARGRKPETDDRDLSSNLGLLPINSHFTAEFDGLVRGLPAGTVKRNKGIGYYGGDILAASGMPGSWHNDRTPGRPMTRAQAAREMDKIVRSEAGSRLHVLCGLTDLEAMDDRSLGRARRVTYDWNLTDEVNEYGPFKRDGSGDVDWRRLEAICTVVARQFGLAVRERMTLPQGFCFSLPYRTLKDPNVPEDWAGGQGTWCGTYV